jgi:nucleoside-diphosphate-sugar epimerase
MRIAVTGAAGYIGGHLTRALLARGHEVTSQDAAPGADAQFDLGSEYHRRQWLESGRPDLVVHLAAKYGRVWGEDGLEETAARNAGLTAELARDCAVAGIRLMYASSSEVYGLTAGEPGPILERMQLRPLNMYGLTKKWGEEACLAYAPDGLAIARLNMPYGPAAVLPQPGAVPHHSGRVGPVGYNALHTMLWQAVHDLPIIVHKGTERCYTWVGDAMAGMALIAESGQAGTWNVCRDDDHVSSMELAVRCVKLAGSSSGIVEKVPDAQVTPRKHLDCDRLWQLGWRPRVSLEEGMTETLQYVSMFDREGRWQGSAKSMVKSARSSQVILASQEWDDAH